jgi:hypothetical protein
LISGAVISVAGSQPLAAWLRQSVGFDKADDAGSMLEEPNADSFRSLAALDHIDPTRWPSATSLRPPRFSAEACKKMPLPPRSRTMKPNPLSGLYYFTVPISSTAA